MKKVISALLVAVMIMSILPTLAVGAATADGSYRTTVTAETIKLDGQIDEAYKSSKKISSSYWGSGSASHISFNAYTLATIKGLYVWAEIRDNTLTKTEVTPAGEGDKFQFYVTMGNGTDTSWGWYDMDYTGRISKRVKTGTLADAEYSSVKLADGAGWRAEMFIPFEGSVTPVDVKNIKIHVGLQANNGDVSAYCYDEFASGQVYFYMGTDAYNELKLRFNTNVLTEDFMAKTPIYVGSNAPTVDGIKDAAYSDYSKVTIKNMIKDATYTGTDLRSEFGDVYTAFDNNYLYIYYEVNDPDMTDSEYFQVYYYFGKNTTPTSGYFCSRIKPSGSKFYGSTGANYGYPGTAITASTAGFSVVGKQVAENKYSLEYRIPLPSGEKAALAASNTASIDIKLAFSSNDYTTTGRRGYGGCVSAAPYLYNYNSHGSSLPSAVLNKRLTAEKIGVINGSSLSLGSDITMYYYASIVSGNAENSYMRFTRNGSKYIVYPQVGSKAGEYKFPFRGIAPQTIGDTIKAELIINGQVVDTIESYSALENCLSIYNGSAYAASKYDDMRALIKALVNYSAAAQKYTEYKIGSLVNSGMEMDLLSPAASNNVKKASTPISDTFRITSAGVYFDNTNKIYVKFIADSTDGVTVMINNSPAYINKVEGTDNTYIAYSDSIPVSRFGLTYRIVLSNGSASQTAEYSIDSYTYSKYQSNDAKMAELAKATFTYGEAARKHLKIGSPTYRVMTYNDGDNSTTKVSQISDIINDYKPDLVGMQEVQGKHVNTSGQYYQKYLPDYGIVYYSHGDYEYGAPILYLKSKFTLVESGTYWLSDTPNQVSKYSDSDYVRSCVWAKFKDKATGGEFVMINTHIDYVATANIKQVKKLLELTANKFEDLPLIYTADWNMYRTSAGYKAMNAAGFESTEASGAGAYKTSTFPNGVEAIDFCFVKSEDFKTVSYKVINDHEYCDTASDHYPVVSDIAFAVKEVAPPSGGNGSFNGEEDEF